MNREDSCVIDKLFETCKDISFDEAGYIVISDEDTIRSWQQKNWIEGKSKNA